MAPLEGPDRRRNNDVILYRLDELKTDIVDVRKELEGNRDRIVGLGEAVAGLRVKSGIWGALAGLIPALLALLYFIASTR